MPKPPVKTEALGTGGWGKSLVRLASRPCAKSNFYVRELQGRGGIPALVGYEFRIHLNTSRAELGRVSRGPDSDCLAFLFSAPD